MSEALTPLAIFGLDVGDLVGQVIRALLDLLVPDFTGRWASRLVAWLVALPQVTDWRQFSDLNAFRRELTHVGYGLLSLTFVGALMQAWAAGLVDGRPVAGQAVARSVLAAGALAVYPTLMGQVVLAVNHLTAAVVRHPEVADGINNAIGGAFVIGAVSSGLSLGLAAGALMAALFFLAAIFVMKVALTAMLCVLLVSGALVIALWPLPQGEGLAKLWGAGLVAAVTIPVSWALVFAVAGLVASDSLVGDQLGPGLEAAVKPFVAVACFYLVYKTPGFLVAQARMLGVRLGGAPGLGRGAPGEARLRRVAHGHAVLQRDRFRALGAMAGRSARMQVGTAAGAANHARARLGPPLQRGAARVAVGAVSAAGGQGPAGGVVTGVALGMSRVARSASRTAAMAGRQGTAGWDWWRQPGSSRRGDDLSPFGGSVQRPTRGYVPPEPRRRARGAATHQGSFSAGASGTAVRGVGPTTQPAPRSVGASLAPPASLADDLRVARAAQRATHAAPPRLSA